MDKTTLVEKDIDEGRRLIQTLDQAGFPVTAALWSYLPEAVAWRLLIASPKVRLLGPRATYAIIQQQLLKAAIDIPLYCITVVSPEEHLIAELRIFADTDPAPYLGGTYLVGAVLGDVYLEKAYLYRAERIIGKTGTLSVWLVVLDKARKVWTARLGKITSEDGFIKKIETEGFPWPQNHTRHGITGHLGVLANWEVQNGKTFGDVARWIILDGRLRSIEAVAQHVPIEGLESAGQRRGQTANKALSRRVAQPTMYGTHGTYRTYKSHKSHW